MKRVILGLFLLFSLSLGENKSLGNLVLQNLKNNNIKTIIQKVIIDFDDFILFKNLEGEEINEANIRKNYNRYKLILFKNLEKYYFLAQKNGIDFSKILYVDSNIFFNKEVSEKISLQAAEKIIYNYTYMKKNFQIEFNQCISENNNWKCANLDIINLF